MFEVYVGSQWHLNNICFVHIYHLKPSIETTRIRLFYIQIMKKWNIFFALFAESFRAPIFRSGPDKDGFSLGRAANFQEVFGDDKKQWFIPTFSRYISLVFNTNKTSDVFPFLFMNDIRNQFKEVVLCKFKHLQKI